MKRQRSSSRQQGLISSCCAWLIFLCILAAAEGAASARFQATPVASKHKSFTLSKSTSNSSVSSLLSPSSSSFSSRHPPWLQGIKNSVASSLAAATSKIILAPFDTIKTLQQHVRTSNQASVGLLEAARIITSRPRGFWELYAGLGVAVVGSMPSVGLYFGVYSYCKQRFQQLAASSEWIQQQDARWVRMYTIALSAAIGNTLASASRVPYEVLKQKLQTNVYRTTSEAILDLAKTGGLRAFFPPGAIAIQTIRDVPYAVVTLLSYEFLRRQQWTVTAPKATAATTTTTSSESSKPAQKRHRLEYSDLLWGGLAGGLGSFATNPFDVIKTRIQTSNEVWGSAAAGGGQKSILWQCFHMTWQEGGVQAFFRGSVPRLLHKVPANALFFVFYEFFRRLLHVQDDGDDHNGGPVQPTTTATTTSPSLPMHQTRSRLQR